MNLVNPYLFAAAPASFVPTDISGCALWLDGSDSAYVLNGSDAACADGDGVKTWQDRSGNLRHFTQATSGSRPTYKTSIINSKNVVRFSVSDLSKTSMPSLSSSTFFLVMKSSSTPSQYILDFGEINGNAIIGGFSGGLMEVYSNPRLSIGALDTSAAHIYNLIRNSSTPLTSTYRDNTSISSSGSIDSTPASATWTLGSASALVVPTKGDICELIVYDTDIGSTNRTTVYDYLKAKWGTP